MSAARATVQSWLDALAHQEGITDLRLDERGLLGLQTDSGLQIELEVPAESGLLYLRAGLGELPAQDRESVLTQLMSFNFLLDQAGGATFALDAERQQLALSVCQGLGHLDATDFANLLQGFIAAAVDWQDKIRRL